MCCKGQSAFEGTDVLSEACLSLQHVPTDGITDAENESCDQYVTLFHKSKRFDINQRLV